MRVRARSVFEGKRKCPGFRNVCDIRFSLRVDVFAFAQQPPCPLLFLPLARNIAERGKPGVSSFYSAVHVSRKNEIVYRIPG